MNYRPARWTDYLTATLGMVLAIAMMGGALVGMGAIVDSVLRPWVP